ncbi:DNA repair protein RecO [Candidatus Methylacidithermus pantelleriae]|uniref:DNA repair protein RecO n=1 Tax=Candidatus Methylacidithermus pantelleriae TaxID=2744239 RepID=UPI00157CF651|nr:DNA repair protein RecO [Candidatus Methylacidithermus pantelleriae]
METASAQGLLVRRYCYSETSLIVHWLTEELGWIRTLAKGARRPKNPFCLSWDPYLLCELELVVPSRSDLFIIKEVQLLYAFDNLRRNWEVWATAEYLVELVLAAIESQTQVADLYRLVSLALGYLEKHPPSWMLVERYEYRVAQLSGTGKDLESALGSSYPRMHRMRERLREILPPP